MTSEQEIAQLKMKLAKVEEKLEKLQQTTRNLHHELGFMINELRASIGEN